MSEPKCCREHRCRRSQPIKVQRGFFTWYAITQWKDQGNGVTESMQKHELEPVICDALEFAHSHKEQFYAWARERNDAPAEPAAPEHVTESDDDGGNEG